MKHAKPFVTAFMIIVMASLPVPTALAQDNDVKIRGSFKKEKLKMGEEEITVVRDNFGVPHVLATSSRGAYFGGGYVVAQDRLWQLERFRRNASGTLAELEGLRAYASDQQVRTTGYTVSEIQAQFDALPGELRQAFQAYVAGINAYLQKAVQENLLPDGFKEAGITAPAPWTVLDSARIAIMMAQRFGAVGGAETEKARILKWLKEKYGEKADAMFNDIFWLDDPTAYTSIPADQSPRGGKAKRGQDNPRARLNRTARALGLERLSDGPLVEAGEAAQQRLALAYAAANNLPTRLGSYGLAISPQRSVSGAAILLAGPQMGFTVPSIGYEFHYSAGDLNVIGMGIPGIPEVLIGHNDHVAWTATSGMTDVVDLFAEKLNPHDKHQYMYQGQYRDMTKRVEVIQIKGRAEPLQIEVYTTRHGPIVAWDEQAGVAYSRAAAFAGSELQDLVAAYHFSRARNIGELGEAASLMTTNRNYLAATDEGDIGYWHCGRMPVRAGGLDPRLPTPGTGEYEWAGFVPFAKMPQLLNPKQGFLVNWNNKPAANWPNGGDTHWGELDYARRIDQLIRAHEQLTIDQVRAIAQDISTYDEVAGVIKQHILAAIERTGAARRDPRVRQAASYMRSWDNHAQDNSVGTAISRVAVSLLRESIFADELGELNKLFNFRFGADTPLQHFVEMSLVLHALEGRRAARPLSQDYLNARNGDEFLVEALNKSLDLSASVAGPQMNMWKWPVCQINLSPLPGIPNGNRATYNQLVELSQPLIRGESILPPGQSEDARSPHFGNQREMAGLWRFKDMLYKREQLGAASLRERECGAGAQ